MGRPRQIGKDTLYRMVEPSRQDAGFWHHRDGIVIKYVWGWIRAAYCTVERVMNTMEWNLICLVCVCVCRGLSVFIATAKEADLVLCQHFFFVRSVCCWCLSYYWFLWWHLFCARLAHHILKYAKYHVDFDIWWISLSSDRQNGVEPWR